MTDLTELQNADSGLPAVEIDPLVLQMLEWELHRIRTELQVVELRVQFYSRDHPSARTLLSQLRAAKELLAVDQVVRLREGVNPEGPMSGRVLQPAGGSV